MPYLSHDFLSFAKTSIPNGLFVTFLSVVSVSHKPLMNLLWTGTILLLLGCTVAAIRRYIDKRAEVVVQTVVT